MLDLDSSALSLCMSVRVLCVFFFLIILFFFFFGDGGRWQFMESLYDQLPFYTSLYVYIYTYVFKDS